MTAPVSVVIPCRNGEAFLGPAISSALRQTLAPAEVIVVDNGSTDRSREVAAGFGPAVRLLDEPRPGAAAARRTGAAAASGARLLFLDADDLLGPDALAALSRRLDDGPDQVAACPWMRFREEAGVWLAEPASCAPRRRGQDDLAAWLTGWYHPPCAVLWSRAALERSGGWDPDVRVNNDGDVMMRGFVRGNRLLRTAEGTSYYRRLPGDAVSLSGTRGTRPGVEARLMVLDRIARMLAAEGTLRRYRAALRRAYGSVAASCGEEAGDLARAAREAAARVGEGLAPCRPGPALRPEGPAAEAAPGLAAPGLAAPGLAAPGLAAPGLAAPTAAGRDRAAAGGARAGLAEPATRPEEASGSGKAPEVSAIIPTWNRAHALPRAVASVLGQDFRDLELLVVDDGSTDGTAEMLAAVDDPRLRHLRQPRNMGVAAARNRGLREARGRFVAFLDSDDEWLPGKLSAQVAMLRGDPRLGLVHGHTENVDANGRVLVATRVAGLALGPMLAENLLHGASGGAVIRREVVDAVGVFDEALPAIEDWDYWVRIARLYEIGFADRPVVRIHAGVPAPASGDRRRSLDFAANMSARETFLRRYAVEMRRAGVMQDFLLDCARRHLEHPAGSRMAAIRLALRALRCRPDRLRSYAWVPYALMPDAPRTALRDAVRALRAEVPARRDQSG